MNFYINKFYAFLGCVVLASSFTFCSSSDELTKLSNKKNIPKSHKKTYSQDTSQLIKMLNDEDDLKKIPYETSQRLSYPDYNPSSTLQQIELERDKAFQQQIDSFLAELNEDTETDIFENFISSYEKNANKKTSPHQTRFLFGGIAAAGLIGSAAPTIIGCVCASALLYKINYLLHAEDRVDLKIVKQDLEKQIQDTIAMIKTEAQERKKTDEELKHELSMQISQASQNLNMNINEIESLMERTEADISHAQHEIADTDETLHTLMEQNQRMVDKLAMILPCIKEVQRNAHAVNHMLLSGYQEDSAVLSHHLDYKLDSINIPECESLENEDDCSTNIFLKKKEEKKVTQLSALMQNITGLIPNLRSCTRPEAGSVSNPASMFSQNDIGLARKFGQEESDRISSLMKDKSPLTIDNRPRKIETDLQSKMK